MKSEITELSNILESIERWYSTETFAGMIAGAYTLWLASVPKKVDIENLPHFLKVNEENESIRQFLLSCLASHWNDYRRYITTFSPDLLRNFILTYKPGNTREQVVTAPEKIHDLIISLLAINAHDYVADMGTGMGDFLSKVHSVCPEAQLWGNEIELSAAAIAAIRAKFFDGKLTIVHEDMFASKQKKESFDKINCFPPWGIRLGTMPSARAFLAAQPPSLPALKGTVACEWIFALRILSSLKKDGRAVLFMTNGGTFNLLDAPIRKYFVERGMIAAVIALPGRLLEYTTIPSSIIVFSNGNTHVQMVDAAQLGKKGRRGTELADTDITRIVNAVSGNDDEIGKLVSNDEILSNDSVLTPSRYIRENIELKNSMVFGSVIKSITRGVSLSAVQLDQLSSKKPTEFQYLLLSNIKDGIIDDVLPFLNEFDSRWERFCLQPNDLILSKIGSPFKIAVASESKQTIIANGNLFIIRLDESAADPYYVKAFLESEVGTAILERASVGTAMPNLSGEAIRNLQIDLPPLQRQKKVAARYKAQLAEIISLKKELAKAVESLGKLIVNMESDSQE